MNHLAMNMITQCKPSTTIVRLSLILLTLLSSSASTLAHNKVVVIPLAGDESKPLQNIVTVAKAHGDFTDPIAAMASITDASEDKPYLIVLAPGRYEMAGQLIIKDFVSLSGSGRENTQLLGSRGSNTSNSSAALVVADTNTSISNLTIENTNISAGLSFCVYSVGSLTLSNTAVKINNGAVMTAIFSINAIVDLDRVYIEANEGAFVTGLSLAESEVDMSDVRVSVSGSSSSTGVRNSRSSVTINDSIIQVFGDGNDQIGVNNTDAQSVSVISNSTITAASTAPKADITSIAADSGSGVNESYVRDSFLTGAVSGDPRCATVFGLDGTALDESCQPPS